MMTKYIYLWTQHGAAQEEFDQPPEHDWELVSMNMSEGRVEETEISRGYSETWMNILWRRPNLNEHDKPHGRTDDCIGCCHILHVEYYKGRSS